MGFRQPRAGQARMNQPDRLIRASFWVAAFLASSALSAQTQPGAAVAGVVVDQTGGVLVGAQVELLNASGNVQSGSTDQSGSFQFEHVRPGGYDVRTTLDGFKTISVHLNVGGSAPKPLRKTICPPRRCVLRQSVLSAG